MPGRAGVVTVLVFLNPNLGVGKQIDAVRVVPVHVRDDYISDVLRRQPEFGNCLGSLDEILNSFSFDDVLMVTAGINQDVLSAAAHQPHHHLQIDFASLVGARQQA